MASECKCVKVHSPTSPPIEGHHSPPQSYPLKPGGVRLVIRMCSNAHGIQHRLLNLYKAHMPKPGQEPRGAGDFSHYHRQIAKAAWAATDITAHIPHTVASPHVTPSRDTLAS